MGKKSKKKLNKIRLALVICIALTVIILGGAFGVMATFVRDIPAWAPRDLEADSTSSINDRDGNVVTQLHAGENRQPADIKDIPKYLKEAFVATEDERFYQHYGVDPKSILRAAWVDLSSGRKDQGASTITQQLVRTAFLTKEKFWKRKIQEAIMAIQLEHRYTKDEILEFYLNWIYFGENAYGVKAAAKTFYGKELQDLTLGESALLAGIPRRPGWYNPFKNPDEALKRQKVILALMRKNGYITTQQEETAAREKINFVENRRDVAYPHPYFVDYVISEASKILDDLGVPEEHLYKGGLQVYTTLSPQIQTITEQAFAESRNFPQGRQDELIQSSMVILDPHTGQIQALMGGRGATMRRGFNRATQSQRQPGSAIKPVVVYAPALEKGLTAAAIVDDVPVTYGKWSPANYDGNYRGLITMRTAAMYSVNVYAVKMLNQIGLKSGFDMGKKLGLSLRSRDRNLAMALGGISGISPLEMAGAYGAFANQGIYIPPFAITRILDRNGYVLYEHKPKKIVAMSEQTAYIITDILQSVVKYGTGKNAQMNRPVAGKTGTTQSDRDAWFVGYTPELVAAVWMGYDQEKSMGKTYGGAYPARLFKNVLSKALTIGPVKSFDRPNGIVTAAIDDKSGLLPSDLTPADHIKNEIFARGTVPKQYSTIWAQAEVCPESGQLATEYCPDHRLTRAFINNREYSKKPWDAELELPARCTMHGPQNSSGESGTPDNGQLPGNDSTPPPGPLPGTDNSSGTESSPNNSDQVPPPTSSTTDPGTAATPQ